MKVGSGSWLCDLVPLVCACPVRGVCLPIEGLSLGRVALHADAHLPRDLTLLPGVVLDAHAFECFPFQAATGHLSVVSGPIGDQIASNASSGERN